LATSALLDSPAGVAVDAAGDLAIADAHNHRLRRVDGVTGIVTTIAGTGAPGMGADGTAAVAAAIDLPLAVAFDAAQNLYYADARTHVVRRIDHATGLLTTVVGNGVQGYAGDGGLATAAAIDSPSGIALDAAGDLFLADTHNQRLRRVDAVTGVITTVAGTGQPGFSGDSKAASGAALSLPRGLALDASGNLFVVDSRNHRIRRVDAVSGQITTIAGEGTQTYAGDGGPAVAASLDTPRAVSVSPANLATLADTGNGRIRQVDAVGVIHTVGGLGSTTSGVLNLTGPAVTLYGTGTLTATLAASPASGSVNFFDGATALASVALSNNAAALPTTALAARVHSLSATYAGDGTHSAAQSGVLSLTISPAPAQATPVSQSLSYGQTIPPLTGSLTGVLAQDAGLVTLALSSAAGATSVPGAYAITAGLTGASAGNYALSQTAAAVTIARAPATISLSNTLAAHVASTTSGVPSGSVTLFDAAAPYASLALPPSGDVAFSSAGLSNGSHTLTAVYGGDSDFLGVSSLPTVVTIGPAASADFSLAATGQTTVTVAPGAAAQFPFAATPVSGALSSPILLTVAGLPSGATASFNPARLPPTNAAAAFILTIQTPRTAGLARRSAWAWALLAPIFLLARRRRGRAILLALVVGCGVGCGDRVNNAASTAASASYNITVTATATSTTGATLQHTAVVTLVVQ
jgi:sugar lactone lactonase YvrE